MNYILYQNDIFIDSNSIVTGSGNYFTETVGSSKYIGRKPYSCTSHSVINETLSFRNPDVCISCKNFVDCCIAKEAKKHDFQPTEEDMLENPIDIDEFKAKNSQIANGYDPRTFVW